VEDGARYTATQYAAAIEDVHSYGRRLAPFFEKYDLLLTPTLARLPLPLGTLNMMSEDFEAYNAAHLGVSPFTPVFNMTGQPAASVPLHWSKEGLPVGVQFVARYGEEGLLLRVASQLEAAHPWAELRPHIATGTWPRAAGPVIAGGPGHLPPGSFR
jgi:Asp-tRNA(Asn)/Glu-tRNA(Gln) amidotransferase A subunit family amidase